MNPGLHLREGGVDVSPDSDLRTCSRGSVQVHQMDDVGWFGWLTTRTRKQKSAQNTGVRVFRTFSKLDRVTVRTYQASKPTSESDSRPSSVWTSSG